MKMNNKVKDNYIYTYVPTKKKSVGSAGRNITFSDSFFSIRHHGFGFSEHALVARSIILVCARQSGAAAFEDSEV